MVSQAAENFDSWIRSSFVEMNTALEELYFASDNPSDVNLIGDAIKNDLFNEGRNLVAPLAAEGNTGDGFDKAFDVLGNLGLFLGALRRHELTNPDRESQSPYEECSVLGMHLASSLGVAPRFATAHLTTRNRAIDGVQKSFTSLPDEYIFLDHNTLGIFSYKRAADVLMRIPSIGISNPATLMLLNAARTALEDVATFNKILFDKLDVARFFFCIRPYYKPYRVGKNIYRGANAGDIAAINQIDLLLGLCRANDSDYAQIMEEKMLYMMPRDQVELRECLGMTPLLDSFLDATDVSGDQEWFSANAKAFIDVCEAHGRTAAQHHNMLVKKYIEIPATGVSERHLKQITASGPPLPALVQSLKKLRDRRMAVKSEQYETAFEKLETLKFALRI